MIDLSAYGYRASYWTADAEGIPARVCAVHRERCLCICEHGEVETMLRGAFYRDVAQRGDYPCVGDFVALTYNDSGPSMINALLPRMTKFSRSNYGGHKAEYVKTIHEQIVAANFDYIFILTSLNDDFNVSRIERYITQSRRGGGQPVVLLTKADLCGDTQRQVNAVRRAAPDLPVIAMSAHTGQGLDELDAFLQPGRTAVLLGMSGVGKSSLLNVLAGHTLMEVNDIRADDSRGRHTTTHRELFMLPSGALVIDTPGMRELGMWSDGSGVGDSAFADVESLFAHCRFSDCGHRSEPGCAVEAALDDGSLLRTRWELYNDHRRETAFVESKSNYLRDKRAFQKSIALHNRGKKKGKNKKYDTD